MIPSREDILKSLDGRFPKSLYEKLAASKVAIAGLGGLGSNIAVMLARTGVGHLHLVDYDIVDISNLNRQVYDIRHLGLRKTVALSDRLRELNPYINITTEDICVNEDNAADIFGSFGIVCEAFDKADEKAMLINTILTKCDSTIVVSGNGMAGYGNANAIITRKAGRRLYMCGDQTTDIGQGIGLMSPRVSICAGHQADKAIELLLNQN